jgi:hypothetical protein
MSICAQCTVDENRLVVFICVPFALEFIIILLTVMLALLVC